MIRIKWSTLAVLLGLSFVNMLVGCAKPFPWGDGSVKLVIDSIAPVQGAAGQPVLIYGSGFSVIPSANKVYFNGKLAVMDTVASYHVLKVFAPAGGTTGNITLAANMDSVRGPVFTYSVAPVIDSVTYNHSLFIYGRHFDPQVSVVTVSGQTIPDAYYTSVGGQDLLSLESLLLNDRMDNPAPIVVTVRGVSSNAYPYLFYPQILNFVPDTAYANNPITIHGLLFGNRSVPSTLRAYFYDPNQRKTYLSPDPSVISWTTNTIRATIPDYSPYMGLLSLAHYYIYLEVSVSTKTTSAQVLYRN